MMIRPAHATGACWVCMTCAAMCPRLAVCLLAEARCQGTRPYCSMSQCHSTCQMPADAGSVAQHTHIKGLTAKLASFEGIVEDIRHRPYDLLNFEATQFDRDFLEFNVHIHDLELTLQVLGPDLSFWPHD